jgi:hypothetical protein
MKFFPLLICFLLWSGAARAQYVREYAFIGPARASGSSNTAAGSTFGILPAAPAPAAATAGSSNEYIVGGGLEGLFGVHEHVGVGMELAGIVPGTGKVGSETIGSLSVNGYYHPLFSSKWDPFVTGGYSLLFRDFTANGFNVGGGLHYWFSQVGLTFECRDLITRSVLNLAANQYLEFRFGVTIRQRR